MKIKKIVLIVLGVCWAVLFVSGSADSFTYYLAKKSLSKPCIVVHSMVGKVKYFVLLAIIVINGILGFSFLKTRDEKLKAKKFRY